MHAPHMVRSWPCRVLGCKAQRALAICCAAYSRVQGCCPEVGLALAPTGARVPDTSLAQRLSRAMSPCMQQWLGQLACLKQLRWSPEFVQLPAAAAQQPAATVKKSLLRHREPSSFIILCSPSFCLMDTAVVRALQSALPYLSTGQWPCAAQASSHVQHMPGTCWALCCKHPPFGSACPCLCRHGTCKGRQLLMRPQGDWLDRCVACGSLKA